MSEQLVTYELDGDIALVGIDRADKRNAINSSVMTQLRLAFVRAKEEAKAGVLFGHGDNFSAGLDLAEAQQWMKNRDQAKARVRGRWTRPLELVARGGLPWIAALKGACIGGGLEVASACQIRVADTTTFFALPEGRRGIFVGGGGAVRIQRLMGYARMADLMLTGRSLNAEEGERANLCQYVVPAGHSLEKAKELARVIATNAETTNWGICAALPRVNDMSHEDGLFFESLIGQASRSGEGVERIAKFLGGEQKVVDPNAPKAEG
ncbi:MAG: crotonase/enoyl-CoA hydratase family protein [Sphingobium sp.]